MRLLNLFFNSRNDIYVHNQDMIFIKNRDNEFSRLITKIIISVLQPISYYKSIVKSLETGQFWNIKDASSKISNPDSLGVKLFRAVADFF